MLRSPAVAGPILLLLIVAGSFWKLLTKQYTWADHPDMAYQVLPWYQFEAESLQHGEFPLWDPHVFGGQPLVGQLQPGAAYPLNWPLFLMPLRNGHIQLVWRHVYYILTHFFAALFCFWLCRDLGRSLAASVFAGFSFALGGLVGSIAWPQMLNGAIWIPLVLLFYLRAVRGRQPLKNAALAGTMLGIAFLSGHHQIPTFTGLMMGGLWLLELWRSRMAALRPIAVFAIFAALVSAFQVLPGLEYGLRSIRWVGSANPVGWGQYVPYTVHQQYSLPPAGLLGLVLSGGVENTFMGVAVIFLALAGFAMTFDDRIVRILGGICAAGCLFAMGSFSVFHGVAYLLIPLVEKARTPQFAIVIVQFGAVVLAAYGLDALRARAAGRWWIAGLVAIGILGWLRHENQGQAVAGLVSLALAAVLYGWKRKRISERAAIVLIFVTALFELGTVTGQNFRHREMPGGFLQELDKHDDVVSFLGRQPDFIRLEVDTDALPYNIGDWNGIDQFRSYLGGMTSNVVPFEIDRLAGGSLATKLFALNYAAGRKPFRAGQEEVFRGAGGLNIYRDPQAFPRFWTVHQAESVGAAADLVPRLKTEDLRQRVVLRGSAPALDQCGGADDVRMVERENTRIVLNAQMSCKGMLVLSQTMYPGWQAKVDGHREPVYEAYGVLPGVVADAGRHRIEIRYRPASVYWGASLTGLGLAMALIIGLRRG
jgi:hypothetical protein